MVVTGTRKDLLCRIADGFINGVPKRCPECNGGRLKHVGDFYICPGFYDDDHFVRCSFSAQDVEKNDWVVDGSGSI